MKREEIEKAITDAMTEVGVESFWRSRALNQIRQGLASNKYFVTAVKSISVISYKSYAKKVTMTVNRVFPDTQVTDRAILTYTFDPALPVSHRVTLEGLGKVTP